MSDLGSCPVCFLDLRPGIPLHVHLDTHPKEMIVKALLRTMNIAQPQQQVQKGGGGQTQTIYEYPGTTTSATATTMTTMVQRNFEVVQQFSQPRQQQQQEFIYQHTLPTTIDGKHYIEASYVQDQDGNYLLCTAAPESALAHDEGHDPSEYVKTEIVIDDGRPPQAAAAEDPQQYAIEVGDEKKEKRTPHPSNVKILSVAVLGPEDNIVWTDVAEEDCISPTAFLPTTPKKSISSSTLRNERKSIDPVPSTSTSNATLANLTTLTTPSPPATPTSVRPVATSVIRTTPESRKVGLTPKPLAIVENVINEQPPTIDLSVDKDYVVLSVATSPAGRNSPQPSTSSWAPAPLRFSKSVKKPPKVLKVKFKTPVHVEEEPQPSTSKQAAVDVIDLLDAIEDVPQPISEHVAAVETVVREKKEEQPQVDEEDIDQLEVAIEVEVKETVSEEQDQRAADAAGMLQLKAEACEEVFISQHSLIKLEHDEEMVPYIQSLNDSKESIEEEMMVAGSSSSLSTMKLYMELKSEKESTLLEELCLSESSDDGSLINDERERMNVNIRAEEVMPAKGEISEQESNADSELLWPSNAVESFETSRILPSYETSVARESWNFGHANSCDNLTFNGIPKLSTMIGFDDGTSIKVESYACDEAVASPSDAVAQSQSQCSSAGPSFAEPSSSMMAAGSSSSKASGLNRSRPYRCPGCPETFRLFRQRKDHIISQHEELLSKKQRYNYMKQLVHVEVPDVSLIGDAGAAGQSMGPDSFKRRIEQLSVIKLHRFLIEMNLKALKGTDDGKREEFQWLLVEFSQRRMYFCTDCKHQFTTMREYRKHLVLHPVKCYTCEKNAEGKRQVKRELLLKQEEVVVGGGEGTSSSAMVVTKREQQEEFVIETGSVMEEVGDPGDREEEEVALPEGDTIFWNWRRFVEHQKMHLGLREVKTCKQCNVSFSSRRKLNLHAATVHRRKGYHCAFCPRTFMQMFRLKEHKKRHHFNFKKVKVTPSASNTAGSLSKQKDYLCPCGEVFHSAAKFAWHKETHEKNPKACQFCRERFVHKNSLSRHIRLAHPEKYSAYKKDTVPCPVCNNQFIRTSLKTHMTSHMKRAEFQCSICSKILSTKWNLKIHRWTHNSRSQMPFKCATCPKAFMRANDLQTHMNTHKAIRPFTCDYCGCQFSRKYNWVRHTREHETEKKFTCAQCNKSFHRAYYLKEHARSHTNERPFECTICGKTSTTKTNHNKHLKIHHARDVTATEG